MTAGAAITLASELATRWEARAAEHDRIGGFPEDDMADLRRCGLLGLLVPRSLGGMGAGFEEYVEVAMVLARGSGASALLFNMHASVTGALAGVPDELARALGVAEWFFEARDDVLRRAGQGAMYGVAISERGAGSRLSAVQTTYAREDGGYRVRGYKSTCSGAGHLDGYLVAARADDDPGGPTRISYFLVPAEAIGAVDHTWNPIGMRATASNGFAIDARVDETTMLGVEGVAVLLAETMPEWLVASYAAVYVGVAQAALAAAVDHARTTVVREPSAGGPPREVTLGASPWVRQRIGRADAQVEAARLAVVEAGRRVDARPGEPDTARAVYRAKLLAGDATFDVAASLTEACGLGALTRGLPLERLLRDARSGAVMPPSSDIAANVLGAAALGMDTGMELGARPW